MPSIIGYANLMQQKKFTKAFISSPQYNRVRRLMDELPDESLNTAADKIITEINTLLAASFRLNDAIEVVTTAITACDADSKWKSDISKEVHSRLLSVIDILMINSKSY